MATVAEVENKINEVLQDSSRIRTILNNGRTRVQDSVTIYNGTSYNTSLLSLQLNNNSILIEKYRRALIDVVNAGPNATINFLGPIDNLRHT
jgi:aspartate ammonia-lyase